VASNRSTGLACGTSGKSLAVVNAQCMLSEILGDGYELMKFDKALPSSRYLCPLPASLPDTHSYSIDPMFTAYELYAHPSLSSHACKQLASLPLCHNTKRTYKAACKPLIPSSILDLKLPSLGFENHLCGSFLPACLLMLLPSPNKFKIFL
jgi:hypothetical protein